jgi:hypothetical protein
MRRNKREVTIGTAHTVTVSSLVESNKETMAGRRLQPFLGQRSAVRNRVAVPH